MTTLGAIDNGDVLLSTVTVVSLALFLPASREGGGVYFGTRAGQLAFFSTLAMLVLTAAATAFSTVWSFWGLVASLAVALLLGLWAIRENFELVAEEEHVGRTVDRSRQASVVAAPARCSAFRSRDGERCRNTAADGAHCVRHTAGVEVQASAVSA